jgi:hypothetical protein
MIGCAKVKVYMLPWRQQSCRMGKQNDIYLRMTCDSFFHWSKQGLIGIRIQRERSCLAQRLKASGKMQ